MKKSRFLTAFVVFSLCMFPHFSIAQTSVSNQSQKVLDNLNSYGTFDNWCIRSVKESKIIGGETKTLYEFFGNQEVLDNGDQPFEAPDGYIWRTNNVIAKIVGIVKTNTTVFPEERDGGYCARIETHMEKVKAMGIIDIEVCCQGAFILGALPEPIKDTKSPMAKVLYGVPFDGRPEALVFDYKADVGHEKVYATGLSKVKYTEEKDYPIAVCILQKRWEDEKGKIHASRVATSMHMFYDNQDVWANDFTMKLHYGDISNEPFFEPFMDLNNEKDQAFHALNSNGKNVMVQEEAWADADEIPTHLLVYFLSSSGGAFAGGVGNTLWIDNVHLVMPQNSSAVSKVSVAKADSIQVSKPDSAVVAEPDSLQVEQADSTLVEASDSASVSDSDSVSVIDLVPIQVEESDTVSVED